MRQVLITTLTLLGFVLIFMISQTFPPAEAKAEQTDVRFHRIQQVSFGVGHAVSVIYDDRENICYTIYTVGDGVALLDRTAFCKTRLNP